MSFELGDVSAALIGAAVAAVLLPPLLSIDNRLGNVESRLSSLEGMTANIERILTEFATAFSGLLINLYVLENGQLRLLGTSLRVYETNPDMLAHIEAARWAIANWSYNRSIDMMNLLGGIYRRLGEISTKLDTLHNDLVGIAFDITAIGDTVTRLLSEILAELRRGLRFQGELTISFNLGGIGDLLKNLDLAKLFGLIGAAALAVLVLAAGLAAIAAFVWALAAALNTLNPVLIVLLPLLTIFISTLKDLATAIAGMDWGAIGKLWLGLAALAGFVFALAYALKQMNPAVLEALEPLKGFIDSLKDLATTLAGLSLGGLATMVGGLAALGGFVYALGVALSQMTPEVLNALGPLSEFINTLSSLSTTLAGLSFGGLATMVGGLAALGGFVYALGAALSQMTPEVLNALGPLSTFIDTLRNLATTLAGLDAGSIVAMSVSLAALAGFIYVLTLALGQVTPQVLNALGPLSTFVDTLSRLATTLAALDAGSVVAMTIALAALAGFVYVLGLAVNQFSAQALQALPALSGFLTSLTNMATTLAGLSLVDLIGMAFGMALIAGFIYLLGMALNTFSTDVLNALPSINMLIMSLNSLVITLAGLSIGDLIMMGIAFALIAGFLYVVGMALDAATPGFLALAAALREVNTLIDTVGSGLSALGDALSSVGSLAGDVLGGIGSGLGALGGGVLDLLPSFQTGGMVEETGPAFLHAGERVLNTGETQALSQASLAPAPSGGGGTDQSVKIDGGITINITAGNLEPGSGQALSEEIVRHLQERLGALRAEQAFRTGERPSAPL